MREELPTIDITRRALSASAVGLTVTAMAMVGSLSMHSALADETHAKDLMRAMSDYLAAQTAFSFDFDASLEVITTEDQRLAIASSGAATLERPDKLHASRTAGFADVEMVFDGETLTLHRKDANLYAEVEAPGTLDDLVNTLREKYGMPLPAADLLTSDVYGDLMPLVVDVKDLGSGVIGGMECDHLAFRTEDTDFQIWIAQGDQPYPCRYAITSKDIAGWPQYVIDVRDWKAGDAVAPAEFALQIPSDAEQLEPEDLARLGHLPETFERSEAP
jgi:hypothetical protein